VCKLLISRLNRILANDNPEEEAESRLWAAPGLPLSASKVENCVPKEERSAISTPLRDFFPSPRLPKGAIHSNYFSSP
jgi:hypothetical protein